MKNLGKIFVSICIIAASCLIPLVSYAEKQDMKINGTTYRFDTVDVYVNDKKLRSDAPAAIVNGRTCVPLRAVSESMDYKVSWSDANKEAHIEFGSVSVNIIPDNAAMLRKLRADDDFIAKTIKLDTQAFIEENTGRIYIPLRAVSEALFCEVEWDGDAKRADVWREFDKIGWFDESGYAEVTKERSDGSKSRGMIDMNGKTVIPMIYDRLESFSEGLASVRKNGKWGAVNIDGEVVIPIIYDSLGPFSEGLAEVEEDEQYGFINSSGKIVIPCIYDSALEFEDGLAWVEIDEKYGYIDKKGNEVIPIKYDSLEYFTEGLAWAETNGKCGFIDRNNKVVIPFEYDRARMFCDGLAQVKKNGKYGFIDRNNKVVIPFEYDDVYDFENGFAAVEKNGKYGCIDSKNNIVIPFEYDWLGVMNENYLLADKNDKSGVIDINNNVVIPIKYEINRYRVIGAECVCEIEDRGFVGVMDTKGNLVVPIEYDSIGRLANSYAEVEKDGEYFYIDF